MFNESTSDYPIFRRLPVVLSAPSRFLVRKKKIIYLDGRSNTKKTSTLDDFDQRFENLCHLQPDPLARGIGLFNVYS